MSLNKNLDAIKVVENELNLTDEEKLLFANYMIGFLSCDVDEDYLKVGLHGAKVFMDIKRKEQEKINELVSRKDN